MSDDRYILAAREQLDMPAERELSTPELQQLLDRAQKLKDAERFNTDSIGE